jgi:hypothetical protein
VSEWVKLLTKELEMDQPVYIHSEAPGTYLGTGNYDFKLKIWRRENKPDWFVAIPVSSTFFKDKELEQVEKDEKLFGIPMRMARYRNTGRKYYQSFDGPETIFAYEYEFLGVENK